MLGATKNLTPKVSCSAKIKLQSMSKFVTAMQSERGMIFLDVILVELLMSQKYAPVLTYCKN